MESNRQSAKIDGDKTWNSLHAYDYMVYAMLQLGQDRAAEQVIAHGRGVTPKPDHVAAAYAYAAMPARLALERGAWPEAAKLPLDPAAEAYQWKKYPQSEAVNAFARGVGAAMSGDAAGRPGRGRAPAGAPRCGGRHEDRVLGRAGRHPGRGGARRWPRAPTERPTSAWPSSARPPIARMPPRSTS